MKIVRGTVQQWTSLDKIKETLTKKGFSDFEDEEEGFLVTIADNDEVGKEFLKVIVVNDDVSKYYKHLEGASGTAIEYLLLIDGFSEFLFVRQNITTLGKRRIEKFKFYRDDPKRSSLEKLNSLEFDNIESFEELFDTRAVVNEFYDEYKKKRTKLISKIQGIKDKTDREKYAQVIFDRLIFLHFIQQKKFLCDDPRFLLNKYEEVKKDKKNYYEDFLKFLFFDLLNTPDNKRDLRHAEFFEVPFLNGGLFREHRIEEENPKIWIGNDIIEEILYFLGDWYWYVDESSDFGEDKALSPEILGHIFEKTITGQKEKGAYYTPEQITRYISENTVFPYCVDKINEQFKKKYENIKDILGKKNTKEISHLYFEVLKKISVLDNAVGSGAFLLAAQKVLLELYKQCWEIISNENTSEVRKENNDIDKHKTPEYHFKKWIISHNVYGVDIEEGAIEICKLRLWLSLVSEFTKETIEPLPNVDYNVMCGNSLVGYIEPPKEEQVTLQDGRRMSDILKEIHKLKEEFSQEEDPGRVKELKKEIDEFIEKENEKLNDNLFGDFYHKGLKLNREKFDNLKPFHWGLKFSDKIEKGGFDIIVGNPPYFNIRKDLILQELCRVIYPEIYNGQNDVLYYFFVRSLDTLRKDGKLSYIVARYFLESDSARLFREYILRRSRVDMIIDFGNNQAFEGVNVLTSIVLLSKNEKANNNKVNIIKLGAVDGLTFFNETRRDNSAEYIVKSQSELNGDIWIFNSDKINIILRKIENDSIPLVKFAKSGAGIQSGLNSVYVVDSETVKKYNIEKSILRNYAKTRDIKPYHIINRGLKVIRITNDDPIGKYPNLKKYLLSHKEALSKRYEAKKNICKWYALAVPRNLDIFDSSRGKIISPIYSKGNKFAYDSGKKSENYLTLSDTVLLQVKKRKTSTKYLLAILNSKLMNYYYMKTRKLKRDNYFEYLSKSLNSLPIHYDEKIVEKVENLVTRLINVVGDYYAGNSSKEEIADIKNEIDKIVYKLYDLAPEEIKIVEESVSNG